MATAGQSHHREALDRLLYVINDRSMAMGLLTGEIGSGKTLTKNVFSATLPSRDFEVISFENSSYSFNDLLFGIIKKIASANPRSRLGGTDDLPDRSDKYSLMQVFTSQLERLFYEEKKHCIVIFDEAQQIADATLDELKNLTNIAAGGENFLSLFFIGQPELREKVKRMRQIDQRIFLRFHLNNLDFNNTVNYINHRLLIAGLSGKAMFTASACEHLFRATGGVPREINRLCKLSLNFACAQGVHEIEGDDIELILSDMQAQCG